MSSVSTIQVASPDEVSEQPGAPSSVRRPRLVEAGVALLALAVPVAVLPMSQAPFLSAKLVLVAAATLCIWAGGGPRDRTLARLAAVWIGVLVLAGALGVDRWWSVTGSENIASGLVLWVPCAVLLAAAPSVWPSLAARVPAWLLGSASAVSAVAIAYRFAPASFDAILPGLVLIGGPVGHPVLLSGLCALAIAAAAGVRSRRPAWLAVGLVVVASGLAVSTKRAGWVAMAVGVGVALWRGRPGRRHGILVAGVVVATLAGWTVADTIAPSEAGVSAAGRFDDLASDSSRARIEIHRALLRAYAERPVLGWGPGNVWGAYLSSATEEEVAIAHRDIGTAHDLVLEMAVIGGTLGLAAFAALGAVALARARRTPPDLGWAVGAMAALAVFHLLQPVSAALTPWLFLTAGLAARGDPARAAPEAEPAPVPRRRLVRGGTTAALVLTLVLSMAILVSAVLEKWGSTYASPTALRASVAVAPGRVTPVFPLALNLAIDARSGDPGAGPEARRLVERLVRDHPYHPAVRMLGVQVWILLDDVPGAHAWLVEQVEVFPGDRGSMPEGMIEFLETGELPAGFGRPPEDG